VLPWSHLLVSVTGHVRSRRTDQPEVLCLVTAAPDGPEQKHARCRSVPGATLARSPNIRRLDWLSLSRRSSLMLSGGARHAGVLAAAKPAHPEIWITAEER
jgi:hypothetical protein